MQDVLAQLLRETLTEPRRAIRHLLALDPGLGTLLGAAAAVAALAGIAESLLVPMMPVAEGAPVVEPRSPVLSAVMQFGLLIVGAGLVFGIGRIFEGRGGFIESLAALVLLNLVGLGWIAAFVVAVAILPGLALILLLGATAWSLWAFGHLVAEIHGFASAAKVLGISLIAALVISVALTVILSILLALFGIVELPQPG